MSARSSSGGSSGAMAAALHKVLYTRQKVQKNKRWADGFLRASAFGQLVLLIGMFVGRLGVFLLLSAIWEAVSREGHHLHRQNRIGYPREDLYV